MLFEGFILMVLTQIWKWIVNKFGVETGRVLIHIMLFGVSLIYACVTQWGSWKALSITLGGMWTTAAGSYEVLKTIITPITGKKE